MVRSLALLALPLLVAGCGSAARAPAPTATIDSFRTAYFNPKSSPSELAAMPASQTESVDRSADAPAPTKAAAAPPKPAAPPLYKASVAAYIKRYAVNGNSLKLAKIGVPFQGSVNGQKGSIVCVELGGLSTNRTAYLLKDNDVVDLEFGAASCRDKKLQAWDNTGA